MNYLSLYRKYRPKSFNDVIGQKYIVKILKNSIKNNVVANAYVFAGTKGTGKTSIAKIYANAINCLNSKEGDVCGECEVCKDFKNNQVLDVIELDGASNNGVDEVRQIADAAITLPTKFSKKVYIIDEAHMLTNQAWNALLKIVEEPPKHVVFIFATTEMHKIPATILSRCQCFRFNKILHSDIVKLLTKVCEAEKIKYELDALKIIADIVDGSARDSLSILEQTATYSDNNIKADDIYKIYGLLSPSEMLDFLNLLASQDTQAVFNTINEYFSSGINFVSFANLIVSILTDKLIYLKTKNYKLLSKTNETLINNLVLNDIDVLVKLIDIWQETYFKVNAPTDVRIVIDSAIIKSFSAFANIEIKEPKPASNQTIKTRISKPIAPKVKKDDNELFSLFDIEVPPKNSAESKKKNNPSQNNAIENDVKMPTDSEILLSIFSTRKKSSEIEATKILDQIKSGRLDEKAFSNAQSAAKVLCANENGVVLIFNDEIDAKLFNNFAKKKDFILACCKLFRNPKFVVGFTAAQINNQKTQMLEAKKHPKPALNLDALRNILNKDASIEQIAFNTIYKFIKDKD